MLRRGTFQRSSAVVACLLALLLLLPASQAFAGKGGGNGGGKPKPGTTTTGPSALILYNSTNTYGFLGELYATQIANLVGHFGTYTAKPASGYVAGEISKYTAVFYVGSTYDEVAPPALLTDIAANTTTQVVWMEHGIRQLAASMPDFATRYGWTPGYYNHPVVNQILYKGQSFGRRAQGNGGFGTVESYDPAVATVVATAVADDGTTLPWAIRSKNLTYIAEIPFPYAMEQDRVVIFSDLMFDFMAPTTPERHRALVRLEDVGPDANPVKLREIADYLSSRGVPFSFGVYQVYRDPNGIYNNGVPESFTLRDAPEVVSAIKYMISKGGTMIMHGYTHQLDGYNNPYQGVSGDDFEFYMAHVDENNSVIYDGPVPGDSTRWALNRVDAGINEFKAAGLPVPSIFEFPHYAASDVDYRAINQRFTTRYDRTLYFKGVLSGTTVDYSRMVGQFFPYVVRDVYGTKVLPENLGNYEPESYNNHPTRFPAEMIETARKNLVVRDGFASFFFHPYLDIAALKETVEGIQALGYTFVSPASL